MITNESGIEKFSWKARAKSFGYALEGIISFFKSEHNAQLHLGATIVALFLSAYLKISRTEFVLILFAIVLVWMAEMINTALEKAMDLISVERHPKIKLVKDIAAGSVLVAAAVAFLTGCIIFLPKILSL